MPTTATARRRLGRAATLVVLLAVLAACSPPPARPAPHRRVLLVGDSLFWGSAFIPGNPQLMPHLVPRLAAEGVEARLIGGPAETPVEQGWPRKVRAEVEAWDPDLVVLASVIPTGVREDRRRLATFWSMTAFQAAARGAEVWRIEPPAMTPGSWYDGRYGPDLANLRRIQAFGTALGAPDRSTVIDLQPLDACPGARTQDGLHLSDAGQRCLADLLAARITGRSG